MERLRHDKWTGRTGGLPWMQRFLIFWLRSFGVRSLYCVMACVIPFYMLFGRRGYKASYSFFRDRFGCPPLKSFAAVYRNHYVFGQVILDRFALYAGRTFSFVMENQEDFNELLDSEKGILLLSSHVGNYEMAGYSLKAGDKPFSALVFSGETQTVMENRRAAFGRNNIRMVPVTEDMSHIFELNAELDRGGIVSMPSDRLFGSAKTVIKSFLGKDAYFPLGPFSMAVSKEVPAVAIFVIKEAVYTYRILYFRLDAGEGDKKSRIETLAGNYVRTLESVVRRWPHQWFNWYDFWEGK